MNEQLLILVEGQADRTLALSAGRMRIGSDPQSELPIAHSEVAPLALVLESRGGAFFVQNHNPYEVYVGEESVPPEGSSLWAAGQTLYLSQNVVLRLQGNSIAGTGEHPALAVPAGGVAAKKQSPRPVQAGKSSQNRAFYQISVIVLCVLLGLYALSSDSGSEGPSVLSFDEVCELFPERMTRDQRVVRNCLQDAWLSELRSASYNPQTAIDAYALVLQHPLISLASDTDESLGGKVKAFAASRTRRLEAMLEH